jgi:PAS domain S-box-containing protein
MEDIKGGAPGLVVQTLLQLCDQVLEISQQMVITNCWRNEKASLAITTDYLVGKNIQEYSADPMYAAIFNQVAEARNKQVNTYCELPAVNLAGPTLKAIRVLLCHETPGFVYVTIESIKVYRDDDLLEFKWRQALEAAGDGVWDLNITTNRMLFSDKWHDKFGYLPHQISSLSDWKAIIHPDDWQVATGQMISYITGETSAYECEFRIKAKGSGYRWISSRGVNIGQDAAGNPVRFIGTHTDIDGRKKVEQQHQSATRLLSILIENLHEGILVTDECGKVVYVNQIFCKLLHYSVPPEELLGKNILVNPIERQVQLKDINGFIERLVEIVARRELVLGDEIELEDGRILKRDYIPVSLKPGSKDQIWKYIDVTEEKTVELRFELQRLFYNRILNSIPTDVVVLDADSRFLFVNPAGVTDKETREWMIGQTSRAYCERRGLSKLLADERDRRFKMVLDEKKMCVFEEKFTKNGENKYFLRYLSPIFADNGAIEMVIVYGVNITDRVLTEQALKTSMDTFANTFRYSGIARGIISPEGTWLELNEKICELFGYSEAQLRATTLRDLCFPDDKHLDVKLTARLASGEIPAFTIEKRFVSRKRNILFISYTAASVFNSDGTLKYMICDFVDITGRKALTEELFQKNKALEAIRENLVNKVNQLEELSRIIGHNLRGPARNISMLSERLIMDDNDPAVEDEVFTKEEAGSLIHESSISLMNSLNTLVDLAQIKMNTRIPYNDCDLTAIIGEIVNQMHGIIYQTKATINLDIQVNNISYPAIYLESILYNLISNSLKYAQPDIDPVITVSSVLNGDRVQLSVKDNGLGIDMQRYGGQIFKLNQVFHKGFDSKGIGLYMIKAQVETLGGNIEVYSNVNEGSEFVVTL